VFPVFFIVRSIVDPSRVYHRFVPQALIDFTVLIIDQVMRNVKQ
jgi:hypothetical protein